MTAAPTADALALRTHLTHIRLSMSIAAVCFLLMTDNMNVLRIGSTFTCVIENVCYEYLLTFAIGSAAV